MAALSLFEFFFFFLSYYVSLRCVHAYEILPYDPVANPDAVVNVGTARFTILTSNIIRMEFSSNATFEDRPTLAVKNRALPVPSFNRTEIGGVLTITTQSVELTYQVGEPFSSTSLAVKSVNASSAFSSWYYGQHDSGNLLGTIKSLDDLPFIPLNCTEIRNVQIHDESLHCEWGLVSRDGWVVVNETSVPALDATGWWQGNSTDDLDIYLFTHGHSYKQALYEYSLIGGKIAMVPRYAAGVWFTRWFNYGNYDLLKLVDDYQSRGIPLDVLVLDMDWHLKNSWTGYTFDPRLFPYPSDTLSSLKERGVHMAANIHDGDGVGAFEELYAPMAEAVGINPASGETVPLNLINSTWCYALDDIVMKNVEDMGMDFWWLDWQQGGERAGLTGGKQNPTIWTDYLRSTVHVRRNENKRGLVLARWGGLGNHRYQVGFSGDVLPPLDWLDLRYQPYFSFTASNVLYGFWSHDIEGPGWDYEVYTRWVQWGSVSAVFRSHDRGMSSGPCADAGDLVCSIDYIWNVPTRFFEANRDALQRREMLVPYLYTAYRQAFDSGLSPLRPMYYDYPDLTMAYAGDMNGSFAQYMLGDDLLVAPVVTAAGFNKMSAKEIWLPPGTWVEETTGAIFEVVDDVGFILEKEFDLSEIPIFVRGGAIVPRVPLTMGATIGVAQQQYSVLELHVYLTSSSTSGSTNVYQDDGATMNYLQQQLVWTNVKYKRDGFSSMNITIFSSGTLEVLPPSQTYVVVLHNTMPILAASVNGVSLSYSRYGAQSSYGYDGEIMAAILNTGPLPVAKAIDLTITLAPPPSNNPFLSGVKGGLQHGILAKANLDEDRTTPGSNTVAHGALDVLASSAVGFSYLAGSDMDAFNSAIYLFESTFNAAVDELKFLESTMSADGTNDGGVVTFIERLAYSQALLANARN